MIHKNDLIKEIKRQYKNKKTFNFLGFVENKDLDKKVENYFKIIDSRGRIWYDWINGNDKLKQLIDEVIGRD